MTKQVMPRADESFDVVVLGSGAGGMTAALVAACEGLSVCLLEKTDRFGGTTAWSGGMVWAPGAAEAAADDPDAVRRYLAALVPGAGQDPVMEAFLRAAPQAIGYLARNSLVQLRAVPRYPDYHSDLPGATEAGRVLEPLPFDARQLGDLLPALRLPLPEFALFGSMMVARADLPRFRNVLKSPRDAMFVAGQMARFGWQRLRYGRGTALVLGNALVARLLASLVARGVVLRRGVVVAALMRDRGRVSGLQLADGQTITARHGVVLATGGFTHDTARRANWLPSEMADHSATAPGATADGARLALALAVGVGLAEGRAANAFMAPVSVYRRSDGSLARYPHTVVDRAKPGVIAVNAQGRRFANEALSYHAFAGAMLAPANQAAKGAWLICDSAFLWRYGLGAIKPMTLRLAPWRRRGYLRSAPDLAALGRLLGLPDEALAQTVARFNKGAAGGEDPDFGRGGTVYERFLGDAAASPNPCVAPITRAPFHAVRIVPGDLGAAAGLRINAQAQVCTDKGDPVPGLYAVGADACSVMQGAYPGPGITLGPALTFGWLAARAIMAETSRAL